MILDAHALFANDIPVDGSPEDLDTEVLAPGPGEPIRMFISVDDGVTGMTGISLQDSDDNSNFSALFTWTGDLAGKSLELFVPSDARRYLRLNIAGTVAAGNWTAGITLAGVQSAV